MESERTKMPELIRRQTSLYGDEILFEMVVKLPKGSDSISYLLTLTDNSLDLATHEVYNHLLKESRDHTFESSPQIQTPKWTLDSSSSMKGKKTINSISRNNILGLASHSSNSHSSFPFSMTIYHLSSEETPTFSRRLTIQESVLHYNCPSEFEKLQLLLNFKPGKSNWLVLVNPIAGKGDARQVFKKAKVILESAGLHIESYETKHKDDAYNYMQQTPLEELQKFDTIICCSGDGIIHEVINGFLERPDHKELTLKIGALPSGSACCLLFNALKARGLELTFENSIYLLLRGEYREMPLMKFTLQPYNRVGRFF